MGWDMSKQDGRLLQIKASFFTLPQKAKLAVWVAIFVVGTLATVNLETWFQEHGLNKLYQWLPAWLIGVWSHIAGPFGLGFALGALIFAFWDPIARWLRKRSGGTNLRGREASPLSWSKTPILGWHKTTDGTVYARTFGIAGQNVGDEEIQLEDVYLVSGITGKRVGMTIHALGDGQVPVKAINPIPPKANIHLSSDEFNSTAGIAEKDFLREWGIIYFIAEYGGNRHRVTFDNETISALFDAERPKALPPHVTRRKQ